MSVRLSNMEQKIVVIEKELNVSTQRMRENTIELTDVPDSVRDEFLESKFIEMMDDIGVKLRENEIHGIHRLPHRRGSTYKPVIAKFVNRKTAEEIMFQKKRFNTKF